MARKVIQPDLTGRKNCEYRTGHEEWLAGIRSVTKWVTIPACIFAAVMIETNVASVLRWRNAGWVWLLLTSLALGTAIAQLAIRLKWVRWSWTAFIASLAVHGYGMYRSYLAFADDYGVMTIIPEMEMLLLGTLLILHGIWSVLARAVAREREGL